LCSCPRIHRRNEKTIWNSLFNWSELFFQASSYCKKRDGWRNGTLRVESQRLSLANSIMESLQNCVGPKISVLFWVGFPLDTSNSGFCCKYTRKVFLSTFLRPLRLPWRLRGCPRYISTRILADTYELIQGSNKEGVLSPI